MQPKMTYRLVDALPPALEYGVIYISHRYKLAVHLCACGCGLEVPTKLAPEEWSFHVDKHDRISMWPSIGNWSFPCRSHYVVRNGAIQWAADFTPQMVAAARMADNPRAHQPKRSFFQPLYNAISWLRGIFK